MKHRKSLAEEAETEILKLVQVQTQGYHSGDGLAEVETWKRDLVRVPHQALTPARIKVTRGLVPKAQN